MQCACALYIRDCGAWCQQTLAFYHGWTAICDVTLNYTFVDQSDICSTPHVFIFAVNGLIHWTTFFGTSQMIKSPMLWATLTYVHVHTKCNETGVVRAVIPLRSVLANSVGMFVHRQYNNSYIAHTQSERKKVTQKGMIRVLIGDAFRQCTRRAYPVTCDLINCISVSWWKVKAIVSGLVPPQSHVVINGFFTLLLCTFSMGCNRL